MKDLDPDKPFPMNWTERFQMAGAVAYVVFLGIPVFLYAIYCLLSLLV